jgi:hypothetical protein
MYKIEEISSKDNGGLKPIRTRQGFLLAPKCCYLFLYAYLDFI